MPAEAALAHATAAPAGEELRRLCPLAVKSMTRTDAVDEIVEAVKSHRSLRVAFANTHLLYCALREPDFADALRSFFIVNDGIGMTLLARLACGAGFRENLNGTDFTPALLTALPRRTRLFLVGARPTIVAQAADMARERWPHLEVCGARDGFEGRELALLEMRRARPDVVLVAMGNPMQERWIARAAAEAPRAVFLGVGALFDFITGAVYRAPPAVRTLRLEWAFRLAQEPSRLWRRYTVEILVILAALMNAQRRRSA
jgi:exopolysaccharide biosynthesis WecB/TagA/CpsF family protein